MKLLERQLLIKYSGPIDFKDLITKQGKINIWLEPLKDRQVVSSVTFQDM